MNPQDTSSTSAQTPPAKKRRGFLDILLSDEPETLASTPRENALVEVVRPPAPSTTPRVASSNPPQEESIPKKTNKPFSVSLFSRKPTVDTPSKDIGARKVTLSVRSAKQEEKEVVDVLRSDASMGMSDTQVGSQLQPVPMEIPRKPVLVDDDSTLPPFPLEKTKDKGVESMADMIMDIESQTHDIPESEHQYHEEVSHKEFHNPVPPLEPQYIAPAETVAFTESSVALPARDTLASTDALPPRTSVTVIQEDGPEKDSPLVCTESPLEPFVHPTLSHPVMREGVDWSLLRIAYVSMEIGIDSNIPTYAGGLGILAGDHLRSATDLEVPIVGMTLLHRNGYFTQHIDESGWQHEEQATWRPEDHLTLLPERVSVTIEGRAVMIRGWMYLLKGISEYVNPVIFLDTNCEENTEQDRSITNNLYSGDHHHRLVQEVVLGIGGFRMLQALGATRLEKFHMNEGHSTLLTVELYKYFSKSENPVTEVRERTVFTTHTPVAAGHDVFPQALVRQVLQDYIPQDIDSMVYSEGMLNMTKLGLNFAEYINGVAKKHGEVTRELFPGYHIGSITNGVHVATWTSPAFAKLFDQFLPSWRNDPYSLRYALTIPSENLWDAHLEAKRALIGHVNARYHAELAEDVFTIGFARRATAYKRGNMLFSDMDRLRHIAAKSGKGIQLIFAGKAHPEDEEGKMLIQQIVQHMGTLVPQVRAVYLEDYDIALAKLVVSGVDLWLNTPMRPQEASGTSGMKAALNGVLHFSVLDGWWLEGHIENATGWSIGPHPERVVLDHVEQEDIDDMYMKLEYVIIPRYYEEREAWIRMMRHAIAINGSFFNTHRMVEQYVLCAYFKK